RRSTAARLQERRSAVSGHRADNACHWSSRTHPDAFSDGSPVATPGNAHTPDLLPSVRSVFWFTLPVPGARRDRPTRPPARLPPSVTSRPVPSVTPCPFGPAGGCQTATTRPSPFNVIHKPVRDGSQPPRNNRSR